MRRLYIVVLAFTAVVLADPLSVNGQLFRGSSTGRPRPVTPTTATVNNPLFNPQVPSIWHQLGIPQSVGRYKQFRESRVNRNGNRPERETKPKLLKLTDPAFLAEASESTPEMLKAAAEIKQAEDLAPQKLKALKYLGTIGCGCYNKKGAGLVEGALMEALEDCTVAVRKEALNVIMKQVSGGCCCCCQPACNSKSCCTLKLYKKLDELANKTDDYGCPLEPDAAVRALASRVMNACPVPPEEKPDETPIITKQPKLEEGGNGGAESEGNDAAGDKTEKDADQTKAGDENASNRRSANTSQVSYGNSRLPGDPSLNSFSPADREFMQQLEVTGVIRSIQLDERKATIEFDDPYEFPQGLNVVIAMDRNNVSFGVVEETQSGLAVIKIEDYQVLNNFSNMQRVRLGVFE